MAEIRDASEEPVTVIIRRRPRPDRITEFEDWLNGIIRAARGFPGYRGTHVIRPSDRKNPEYVIIFSYDNNRNMEAWETSEVRREWLAKVEPLQEKEETVGRITGLEYWFGLPDRPLESPPARYKMVIVIFLALFPLLIVVPPLVAPALTLLPSIVQQPILVIGIVALMTYVMMPLMTRLLAFWLYGRHRERHDGGERRGSI